MTAVLNPCEPFWHEPPCDVAHHQHKGAIVLCALRKPCPAHIPVPFMPFATADTQLHPSQGEAPQRLPCVHQCPHYAMPSTQRCYLQEQS